MRRIKWQREKIQRKWENETEKKIVVLERGKCTDCCVAFEEM